MNHLLDHLATALSACLNSAHPNTKEHPGMSAAWKQGQAALDAYQWRIENATTHPNMKTTVEPAAASPTKYPILLEGRDRDVVALFASASDCTIVHSTTPTALIGQHWNLRGIESFGPWTPLAEGRKVTLSN